MRELSANQRALNKLADSLRHQRAGARPTAAAFPNGKAPGPALEDAKILELLFSEKERGAEFEALYNGGLGRYPSASEAVAAILSKFAFYSGRDPVQMERLIRSSGLASPKFDERRGTSTWLGKEIARAVEATRETYRPAGRERPVGTAKSSSSSSVLRVGDDDDDPPVVWFHELGKPKPREFLVKDVVPKNYPTTIYGEGGVAKSMLALLLGITVASVGDSWLGLPVHEHGLVIYADFELEVDEQQRRVHDLCNGLNAPVPKRLAYISGRGYTSRATFERAYALGKEQGAKLLLVDSFGLAMEGDMGSSTDVLEFMRKYIDPVCKAGITPFIVDHISKTQAGEDYQSKTAFGSAYKSYLVRSALQVQGGRQNREAGTLHVRVRHHKTNFGFQRDPFDAKLTFSENKIEVEAVELDDTELLTEQSLNSDDRVVLALRDGPSYSWEVAARTSLSEGTVKNCFTRLRRNGTIEDTGETDGKARQVQLTSSSLSPRADDDDDSDPNQEVWEF